MRHRANQSRPAVLPGSSRRPPGGRAIDLAPGSRTAPLGGVERGPLCQVVPGPWCAYEQGRGRGEIPRRRTWIGVLSRALHRARILMLRRDRLPILDPERLSDHLLRDLGITSHVEQVPPRR